MNISQLNDEESKQTQRDTEQAGINFFNDVPTLRKLISAFEGDLRELGNKPENGSVPHAGKKNRQVRA